ncbi:tRNA (adenosine(37)-N6)-dimethylallyltransferase MiaA [Nonlabens marinus]|uniref:tRNA dimethylallyltransferase n=1 Tax=Nonlabens marinus S1-08 TaxID=1454201 RepID=W8W086_9FLAO|nr:tRNA (adenosine(37)-N6)-dimethylallyltransferase MiaA [Nonlabens marinus]BAO55891.1 tRNA delta(2)-isopentenylpyrophosphate transferase [Nonlabens marinus S1-08]
MQRKRLITIIGPTAVGKTALGIAFSKAYQTEIISCDSRQFFKEMTIGTAVPSTEELEAAPHHFIQNLSIHQDYSVGDFERDAIELLDQLFKKHDEVIMVGGSALYEKAITHGLDDFPEVPEAIEQQLEKELNQDGLDALVEELRKVDHEYAAKVDISNPRRILRALSIYRSSGETFSSFRTSTSKKRSFEVIKIGLEAPREELYARINHRVDVMLKAGLLEEVRELLPYKELTALKTVGYQELFPYLEYNYSLEEGIRLIKRNSRRFAKRQMTWYRKDPSVTWFSYKTRHTEIVKRVQEKFMES